MKTVSRVISAAVLLILSALLCAAASQLPLLFGWYPDLCQQIHGILGAVTAVFPFPLWEVLTILLIVWTVASLISRIRHGKILRWLSGFVWGVSLGVFLFVALWGLGSFLPTKTEQIVTLRETSAARLADAAAWYGGRASALAGQLPRDEAGKFDPEDLFELSRAADGGFAALSARCDSIPEASVTVKPLFLGDVFSYTGTTGIFVPFTSEPCFNPNTYGPAMPFTICHERAHRLGANSEADANFIAYLACAASEDVRYRYSGEFSAFLYCYNALYKLNPQTASAVWQSSLSPQVQEDLLGANAHYEPYKGTVQDTAQSVNDAYLKAFHQEAGVASYGMVSDALIAWYLEQAGEIPA